MIVKGGVVTLMTFYAHQMGFIDRDVCTKKFAVNFEAVPKETVEMFVTKEMPAQFSQEFMEFIENSQYFEETRDSFFRFGPEDETFRNLKPRYLSEVPDFQIMLLFEDYWKACEVLEAETDWWEIGLDPDSAMPAGSVSALCSMMPEENEDREIGDLYYRGLSSEENKILYDLYVDDAEGFQDDGNSGVCGTGRSPLGAITPATTFSKVQVLYVGAGLSCRLVDDAGIVAGYFDMGQELPLSAFALARNSPFAAALNQVKQSNINIMVQDAAAGTAMTVIISHWHYDHVRVLGNLARDFLQNGNFAAFWTNLTLICPAMMRRPGWSVTDYNSITAALNQLNPAGFQPLPNAAASQVQTVNLGNVTLYKADIGGPGFSRTEINDPHNHGLAAVIRLGGGNVVFLPGDSSYDTYSGVQGLLDRGGIGYEYLVAAHHGGTYTYNKASNPACIPVPDGTVPSTLIYSANGVAFGHPNPVCMADYANSNWNYNICLRQFCRSGQFEWYELL